MPGWEEYRGGGGAGASNKGGAMEAEIGYLNTRNVSNFNVEILRLNAFSSQLKEENEKENLENQSWHLFFFYFAI